MRAARSICSLETEAGRHSFAKVVLRYAAYWSESSSVSSDFDAQAGRVATALTVGYSVRKSWAH